MSLIFLFYSPSRIVNLLCKELNVFVPYSLNKEDIILPLKHPVAFHLEIDESEMLINVLALQTKVDLSLKHEHPMIIITVVVKKIVCHSHSSLVRAY